MTTPELSSHACATLAILAGDRRESMPRRVAALAGLATRGSASYRTAAERALEDLRKRGAVPPCFTPATPTDDDLEELTTPTGEYL